MLLGVFISKEDTSIMYYFNVLRTRRIGESRWIKLHTETNKITFGSEHA